MKKAIKIVKIKKLIKNLDNNLKIDYPLTESKKILLISLQKSRIAISECINLGLIILEQNKKIKPSKNKETNLNNFIKNAKQEFEINQQEIEKIKEILEISRKQRQSVSDFKRKERIIILDEKLNFDELTIEKLNVYLELIKIILQKILLSEKLEPRKI